jgi:hypothetical protein
MKNSTDCGNSDIKVADGEKLALNLVQEETRVGFQNSLQVCCVIIAEI